jgi:hypothetical protein
MGRMIESTQPLTRSLENGLPITNDLTTTVLAMKPLERCAKASTDRVARQGEERVLEQWE